VSHVDAIAPTAADYEAFVRDCDYFRTAHSAILETEPRIRNPFTEFKDVGARKWKEIKTDAGVCDIHGDLK
jgi:hypothetical protein